MFLCPHCDQEHAEGTHFCPVTGRPFVDVAGRMAGRVLGGRYRLGRVIGQGGMGTVFEALHTSIGTKVAIKVLHEPFAEKREPVQRLYREARATGAIGHPGIIKVFDVGETEDGIPFLVMELLEGESLGEHIERLGPRPLGFVLDVGARMLSALHAAHRAGIIHRDLKSDNVFLLSGPCEDVRIKILDFGISKFTTPEGESLRLTQTGSVLGTPYYMAPEQARGLKGLDHRLDLYSAGVILYEMLLGTIPHRASNYNALLIEIITQDAGPFRHLRADVPERLEAAVLRALSRDREERWPDAISMMAELNDIREGIPAAALRGASPAVDEALLRRCTVDPETVDFCSPPVGISEGGSPAALAAGAPPGAVPGARRRRAILGAGGGAVLLGVVLAGMLAFGGGGKSEPTAAGPAAAGGAAPIPRDAGAPEPTASLEPVDEAAAESEESIGRDAGALDLASKPEPALEPAPAPDRSGPRAKAGAKTAEVGTPAAAGQRPASGLRPGKKKAGKGSSADRPTLDRPMDNPF